MNTSKQNSDILRPYRTLEKDGVHAVEWTDGNYSGIKFTISSAQFKNDEEGNPLLNIEYVLHDNVDFNEKEREEFEEELTEFTFGLIIFGKVKDEDRTNDTEQPDS